ncbi:putative amastin-like protein [Leishmania mexicana MHOM/GT/2001/U1103]|uniref:Amastin-like protein n=1 Tax=Leishmania mexicana (strain MHOM/GT/2001/U1103) TaxID=929439 RepID=E9AME9_LEIMU|nr:putative amastin-like protein [Leishmania mexicana MHOM/GT/2001/U1103]CBZ24104.1 putative amastin-like protein [Leishmania mexicana MHOM/GT/2001/U1103]
MACRCSMILYALLQFLAFLFVLVATPIDMFRPKGTSRFASTQCLTLWGEKMECFNTVYTRSSDELWANCTDRRIVFRASEALAVISIFVYALAFILGFIMLFCCFCLRWVCLTLNIIGSVTLSVVWVLMVVVYYTDDVNGCQRLMKWFQFGLGFILLVSAWCLDVLGILDLLILC